MANTVIKKQPHRQKTYFFNSDSSFHSIEKGIVTGVISSFAIGLALYPIEVAKILSQTATSFKHNPHRTTYYN